MLLLASFFVENGCNQLGTFVWNLYLESWTILDTFSLFWEPFGVTVGPLASLLELFGYTCFVKKRTRTPKVCQERPKALTPEIKSLLGIHFGLTCLIFYKKKEVLTDLIKSLENEHSMGGLRLHGIRTTA